MALHRRKFLTGLAFALLPAAAEAQQFLMPGNRAREGAGFGPGVQMLFVNAAAPPGWVRVTTFDDALLRCVGTAAPGSGGTNGFVASFNSQTVTTQANNTGTGTSGATALSIAQLAAHTHAETGQAGTVGSMACGTLSGASGTNNATTGSTGSGSTHTHTVPALSIPSLGVNYVGSIKYADALIAKKT